MIKGKINSFLSLGTLDGPGVRFVVFMQGCPLRCACCHNPETWDTNAGNEFSAEEVFEKIIRYKEYFGDKGGVTVSGGEPLIQAEFVTELFKLCKENNISTCLDTSGCIISEKTDELLKLTDHCLLDFKYTNKNDYLKYTGLDMSIPLKFLKKLKSYDVNTVLRQVIIEGLNDNEDNILYLLKLKQKFSFISEIELLPFKKLCEDKYKTLGIDFKFKNFGETSAETIDCLNKYLKSED